MTTRFSGFYRAKFEREAKERPSDWIIRASGHWFELVYIGE